MKQQLTTNQVQQFLQISDTTLAKLRGKYLE